MFVVRAYHDLTWLAQAWGARLADIAYLGENDLLQLSIRVFDEALHDCPADSATEPALLRTYSGLLALRSPDVFCVFRDGDATVNTLIDPRGKPVKLLTPKFVLMGDLVVAETAASEPDAGSGNQGLLQGLSVGTALLHIHDPAGELSPSSLWHQFDGAALAER
jgi:hypothetical protein